MIRGTSQLPGGLALGLAVLLATAAPATAQQRPPPPGQFGPGSFRDPRPPTGQFAIPPPGAERPGAIYGPLEQAFDRDYAQSYAEWAARNCVDRRNNAAAGAAIGGVMGAIVGSGVAGPNDRGTGAIVGGAVGAAAGAAIGSGSNACPPGYLVRPGAPPFRPVRPAPPQVISGPGWYNPWAWNGRTWVYRPYRYWYWDHRSYWRPGTRPGRWDYRYRRW